MRDPKHNNEENSPKGRKREVGKGNWFERQGKCDLRHAESEVDRQLGLSDWSSGEREGHPSGFGISSCEDCPGSHRDG